MNIKELLDDCNNILQQSIDNNQVSNDLGHIILHIINKTYYSSPKNFNKLIEDEIRDFALLRVLQSYKYWNKDKSSAKSFLIYITRRFIKDHIKNHIDDHIHTNMWNDEIDVAYHDENFDNIRYDKELPPPEPVERLNTPHGSLKHLSVDEKKQRARELAAKWYIANRKKK